MMPINKAKIGLLPKKQFRTIFKIEKENEEQIINFGVFNYDALKIANILGLTETEIETEIKNENSDLSKLLQKGRDMADFVIDLKLFEMAKSGDIKALEKLDYRKRIREEATEKRLRERKIMERNKNNR
jgi:hypothetical protein